MALRISLLPYNVFTKRCMLHLLARYLSSPYLTHSAALTWNARLCPRGSLAANVGPGTKSHQRCVPFPVFRCPRRAAAADQDLNYVLHLSKASQRQRKPAACGCKRTVYVDASPGRLSSHATPARIPLMPRAEEPAEIPHWRPLS